MLAFCLSVSFAFGQGSIRLLTELPGAQPVYDIRKAAGGGIEADFGGESYFGQVDTVHYDYFRAQFDSTGAVITQLHRSAQYGPAEHGQMLFLRDGALLHCFTVSGNVLRVEKLGPSNAVLWQKDFQTAGVDTTSSMRLLEGPGGDLIVLAGIHRPAQSANDRQLLYRRLTAEGDILSSQEYPYLMHPYQWTNALLQDSTSTCYVLINEFAASSPVLWKIDSSGQLLSRNTSEAFEGLVLAQGNRLAVSLHDSLAVLDTSGIQVFQVPLFDSLSATQNATIGNFSPVITGDGGFVVPVLKLDWVTSKFSYFLKKWSATGTELWERDLSFIRNAFYLVRGREETNGDLSWIGRWNHPTLGEYNTLVRTDASGIIFDQRMEGRISLDANADCAPDALEAGAKQYLVQLDQGNFSFVTATSDSGAYVFSQVDAGPFSLHVLPPSNVWGACGGVYSGVMPDSTDYTLHLDRSVEALADCPAMTIDLGTPFLRPCMPSVYTAQYCNVGSAVAQDARVDILLPAQLDFTEASLPVEVIGDTLRFLLGTVPVGACGLLTFTVIPDCDSVELGQTLCVEAAIYPDTICVPTPGWSGGVLQLSGQCTGDSIEFRLKNVGDGPTTDGLDFIVIEDHVITRSGALPALPPGAEYVESVAAAGNTYRLTAMQEPNAPGASNPSLALEACNGSNSFHHILPFDNESGPAQSRIFCIEVRGAYDPNDKQAFPEGVGDDHTILPDSRIRYQIRFQNTGTDTAFTVVVLDTLSPLLDPATIRVGAASQPYTWELLDSRVLAFRFSPALLPDSNVNEPASHGFLQFSIAQYPGLPDGFRIENRAAIYFDFNDLVRTNAVFHTVGRKFLSTVGTSNPAAEPAPVFNLYPNPAHGSCVVFFNKADEPKGTFTLFDALGRVKWVGQANGNTMEIPRNGLPAGVYGLRWEGTDGTRQGRRIIWY